MGFYADFITKTEEDSQAWEEAHRQGRCPCPDHNREEVERRVFRTVSNNMRDAKIVRLGGDQAQVFLEHPIVEGQDYLQWFRLPFPQMYIHLEPSIPFVNYRGECDHGFNPDDFLSVPLRDPQSIVAYKSAHKGDPSIKGALLVEPWVVQHNAEAIREHVGVDLETEVARTVQVVFLMPLPDWFFNLHIATGFILKDGRLRWYTRGLKNTRMVMLSWAIHLVNFLSSPSVKMLWTEPPVALQKARTHRGKDPLPGWYEITYRKVARDYTKDKVSPQAWEHSFRYDVRGHFKRFTRGRMMGRVVWCPPHQRGIKHSLYKPKTYRVGTPRVEEGASLWEG